MLLPNHLIKALRAQPFGKRRCCGLHEAYWHVLHGVHEAAALLPQPFGSLRWVELKQRLR